MVLGVTTNLHTGCTKYYGVCFVPLALTLMEISEGVVFRGSFLGVGFLEQVGIDLLFVTVYDSS